MGTSRYDEAKATISRLNSYELLDLRAEIAQELRKRGASWDDLDDPDDNFRRDLEDEFLTMEERGELAQQRRKSENARGVGGVGWLLLCVSFVIWWTEGLAGTASVPVGIILIGALVTMGVAYFSGRAASRAASRINDRIDERTEARREMFKAEEAKERSSKSRGKVRRAAGKQGNKPT